MKLEDLILIFPFHQSMITHFIQNERPLLKYSIENTQKRTPTGKRLTQKKNRQNIRIKKSILLFPST